MTDPVAAALPEPQTYPEEFLDHLGFVVNRVAEGLNRQVERVIVPHGLSVGQYGLLLLLQAAGPQAQVTLSQRVGLDRTTVMRSVDLLESRELVRRDPHPTDRRKHSVALTATGAALLERTLPHIRRAEAALTARLSAPEQQQLTALLRRLLEPSQH